jgi:hypothetical protein
MRQSIGITLALPVLLASKRFHSRINPETNPEKTLHFGRGALASSIAAADMKDAGE